MAVEEGGEGWGRDGRCEGIARGIGFGFGCLHVFWDGRLEKWLDAVDVPGKDAHVALGQWRERCRDMQSRVEGWSRRCCTDGMSLAPFCRRRTDFALHCRGRFTGLFHLRYKEWACDVVWSAMLAMTS